MPYKRKDSPHWWISWTDSAGKQSCRSSGTTDHRKARRLEAEVRARAQQEAAGVASWTFDQVALAYLESKPTHRAAWAVRALSQRFSGRAIADITPQELADYKTARGVSMGTLKRELGVLRAAIRHCRRELGWHIPEITAGRIPPEPPHRLRWLSKRQACRLLAVARRQRRAPYLADFIILALHTGMRRGELLGLEWSRVDLRHNVIHLEVMGQKGRRDSAVPLNEHARQALLRRARYRAELCPASPWVFTRHGERLANVRRSFETACRVAGIQGLRIHDLRHTCAAWLVQTGVPLRTVAEILRHRDIATTMRYAHLAPDDARAGVRALEAKHPTPAQRSKIVVSKRKP